MHQISHTHSMYRNTYFYILFVFFEINSISFILLLLINDDVIIVWLVWSGKNIHITLLWCTKNILSPYQLIWLHNCIIIISGHLWFKRISFFSLLTQIDLIIVRLFFMTSALLVTFLAFHYQIRHYQVHGYF